MPPPISGAGTPTGVTKANASPSTATVTSIAELNSLNIRIPIVGKPQLRRCSKSVDRKVALISFSGWNVVQLQQARLGVDAFSLSACMQFCCAHTKAAKGPVARRFPLCQRQNTGPARTEWPPLPWLAGMRRDAVFFGTRIGTRQRSTGHYKPCR